ncbi:MAG: tRNA pseudouridine(38-40) synthase TruA [Tidjanibacter sp.]|nr:tRNA pseudouridine(38-40) synthase TruA [Tidjanibacter sp.]
MRYFMELSYDGGRYNGWQIQNNAPSIQEELQKGLSMLLRQNISVTGAGRTDTGVHAAFYVAHFDSEKVIENPKDTCYHLNKILPHDIAVSAIYQVCDEAHARFDAKEREYRYFMVNRKNPFKDRHAWLYHGELDVEQMNRAAEALLRHKDFTSFAKLNSGNKTNICHIKKALWQPTEDGYVFIIRADRFLRNMVRALTGTLVDVGRGKISPERFEEIIEARNLSLSSSSAPAQGLFLYDVVYDKLGGALTKH